LAEYVELPVEADPDTIADTILAALATGITGWVPAEGDIETFLARRFGVISADIAQLAAAMGAAALYRFGTVTAGVAPITATSATVTSTWTAADNAGYTIPAGTQVTIARTGDEVYGFEVVSEVSIPAGSTATSAGEVTLRAIEPGTDANGLTANPVLVDALAWVSAIATVGTSAGGVDAEEDREYLSRLAETLSIRSPRPVVARDVEILARSVAGVERALALDGYDLDTATDNNEKTTTVFLVDENGEDVAAGVKTEVEDLLEEYRELNYDFDVGDPTRTNVAVGGTTEVVAKTGYATADVEAAAEAAITAYFDPANWGNDSTDPSTNWANKDTVYINEIVSLLDSVEGVERVVAVQTTVDGVGPSGTDKALDPPAPLPNLTSVAVTVS
jgi:hypothetical protein